MDNKTLSARRSFLQFLLASPLCYSATSVAHNILNPYAPRAVNRVLDAVNVFDFHEVAKTKLDKGHYAYMAYGSDAGATQVANREGFLKYQLRMRRLVDVRHIDTAITLFGEKYSSPIMLAPCGRQGIYHPDGELAVAKAAKNKQVEFVLSTVGSTAVEAANKVKGSPVWFQLYPSVDWQVTHKLVKRVEDSGCKVLVLTVDMPATNREALNRFQRNTNPECQSCHSPSAGVLGKKPMLDKGVFKSRGKGGAFMDWAFVKKLQQATSMKIIIKGIVTAEDAQLCIENKVDGIIVSNHGGRAEDSGRSTIECLPEVANVVQGRIPVLLDGGIRRGTDIFKALALGADAIAIGQPYLWGLASFGQEGVEGVIDLLHKELITVMKQARTTKINMINQQHVI